MQSAALRGFRAPRQMTPRASGEVPAGPAPGVGFEFRGVRRQTDGCRTFAGAEKGTGFSRTLSRIPPYLRPAEAPPRAGKGPWWKRDSVGGGFWRGCACVRGPEGPVSIQGTKGPFRRLIQMQFDQDPTAAAVLPRAGLGAPSPVDPRGADSPVRGKGAFGPQLRRLPPRRPCFHHGQATRHFAFGGAPRKRGFPGPARRRGGRGLSRGGAGRAGLRPTPGGGRPPIFLCFRGIGNIRKRGTCFVIGRRRSSHFGRGGWGARGGPNQGAQAVFPFL